MVWVIKNMFSPTWLQTKRHDRRIRRSSEKQQVSNEKDWMSTQRWKTTRSKKQSFWYLGLLHASTSVFNMWAPKECLKSQFPCSSFFPLFNFGILWSTASVILVSVYLLKTLQHLLPCLLPLKWLLKRMKPQMSLRTSNTEKWKAPECLGLWVMKWLDGPGRKPLLRCHLG